MTVVREAAREVEVVHETDVLVVGSGLGHHRVQGPRDATLGPDARQPGHDPPGEAAAKVEALIRTAEQYRPMLQVLVQPMILPVLAKLYEPLATRDIDDFAAALETPQGQRMTTGLAQLTGRTLSQLVMDFTTEFVRQSKAEMQ